eukprot:TRINITY_DN2346_c0_g1_i1.p1 TRINITY_DN2346_c0_g1~~TRINITY_DN2346_c0_g1_i1.p1  ORF type:complete len:308 (-),score=23.27 TRINITY_DN2346_c0_g1_i1:188-1111(-)
MYTAPSQPQQPPQSQYPTNIAPMAYPPQPVPQGFAPQGYPPQGYPGQSPQIYQPGPAGVPGYQAVPMLYPVMAVPASGLELMKLLTGIYLKQKLDAIEAFVAYEKANKYKFFPIDQNGNKAGNAIFKAKEKSEPCDRYCFGAGRAFEMTIKLVAGDQEILDFLHLQRPTVCCRCDKGEMTVTLLEGGSQVLGFITGPCTCCQLLIRVFDSHRNLRYSLKGDACQCSIVCAGCPCEKCRVTYFTLNDAAGNVISTMQRRSKFFRAMISDADDFSLIFPSGITVEDKCLLIASLIMMDYAYFEQKPSNS